MRNGGYWKSMAKINRIKLLADAAAASFEAAGFSPAELLQGPITFTDLTWQATPLAVATPYWGVPFRDYLDYPLDIDPEGLYDYYRQGLLLLSVGPEEITDSEGYKGLTRLVLGCRKGERRLALPLYEGWPEGSTTTGPVFALEMAHIYKTSCREVKAFVADESNYYADTPWGKVGVVDGYVSDSRDLWDVDCRQLVPEMLAQPRGQPVTECQYDVLARLRSALYQEPERFKDLELLDLALQALRILSYGELCHELVTAVSQMSSRAFKRKLKIEAYSRAVDIMKSWNITDRVKISMLQELLMPAYMSLPEFSRKIWDPHKIMPSVLSTRSEARIMNYLTFVLRKTQDAEPTVKPG